MKKESSPCSSGNMKPVRESLPELLADLEANLDELGGVGGRLLDQSEINRLFDHGNADD